MKEKDSYQKLAEDMFGPIEKIAQNEKSAFHRVKKQDLDEVVDFKFEFIKQFFN